jgi:multidrug efflux pump subunit AcrA (membrane-fusion protein)
MRMHSHEVHDTRAAYVMAREALRQAEDKSALALRVRDRARRLLALEAISKEQVDQAETEWKSSAAAVDSARAQVERERTHLVDVLEVPLDKSGNPEDIDTVPVRAPAAGVVIERKATVGSVFSSGDVMLTITDPSTLWVIVNANEVDLPALRPGQRASVQVRAYPDRNFTGQIARLGESLDPVTRTLQVRVVVPNREGLLKPEMFATVTIARNAARKAITVPRDSVQDVNGQQSVFVQKSNQQFRQQVVKLGQSVADRVEVVSGLQPGDRVVVRGSFEVKSELLKSSLKEE